MKQTLFFVNKINFIFSLLIVLMAFNAFAKTTSAKKSGDWESANTWTNGIPADNDIVNIPSPYSVKMNSHKTLDNIQIYINGNLHLDNGQKLTLDCDSYLDIVDASATLTRDNNGSKVIICSAEIFSHGVMSMSGPASFGRNPLPIELISFTANTTNTATVLKWTTATEINNDYFTIEKSVNGINFTAISEINGAGNSTNTLSYSYSDVAANGTVYYRLKQTDFDGKYSYSKVISVSKQLELVSDITLYPNPAASNGSIVIKGLNNDAENVNIELYDITGRKAFSNTIYRNENNEFELKLNTDLNSGVYFLKADGLETVKKIVIK